MLKGLCFESTWLFFVSGLSELELETAAGGMERRRGKVLGSLAGLGLLNGGTRTRTKPLVASGQGTADTLESEGESGEEAVFFWLPYSDTKSMQKTVKQVPEGMRHGKSHQEGNPIPSQVQLKTRPTPNNDRNCRENNLQLWT